MEKRTRRNSKQLDRLKDNILIEISNEEHIHNNLNEKKIDKSSLKTFSSCQKCSPVKQELSLILKENPPASFDFIKKSEIPLQCKDCDESDGLWTCMEKDCLNVGCGRYAQQHAIKHFQLTKHDIVFQFESKVLHCYACEDDYVFNEEDVSELSYLNNHENEELLEDDPSETQVQWEQLKSLPKSRSGLQNLGNTCYINATIQLLSNITSFRCGLFDLALLQELKDKEKSSSSSPPKKKRRESRTCTLTINEISLVFYFIELCRHFCQSPHSHRSNVCPLSFVSAIKTSMPFFRGYRQQDAQEFLRLFIDKIHEEITTLFNDKSLRNIPNDRQMNINIITDLFQGYLENQVTCLSCGQIQTKVEPFLDLSLDIPRTRLFLTQSNNKNNQKKTFSLRNLTLQDCLASFTRLEHLDPSELYMCSTCHEKRPCTKKMQIKQLPKLFFLHLKRFQFGNRRRSKIRDKVIFPLKDLDFTSYCCPLEHNHTSDPIVYNLVGVICHHGGSVGCGHYSSFNLEEKTNTWLHCNDTSITVVPENVLHHTEPYILLYKMIQEPMKQL